MYVVRILARYILDLTGLFARIIFKPKIRNIWRYADNIGIDCINAIARSRWGDMILLLSSFWSWLVPAIAWIGFFTGLYIRRKSIAKNTGLPQLWRLRAPTPGRVTPGRESGIHLRPARQACRRSFAAANISRRRIAFMRA